MPRKQIKLDLKEVRRLAGLGLHAKQIALCLGIHEATLHRRKAQSTRFAEALEAGRADGIARAAAKLKDRIEEGSERSVQFYLERVGKWSADPQVAVNVQTGDAIAFARELVARIISVLEREVPDREQRRRLMDAIRTEALRNG